MHSKHVTNYGFTFIQLKKLKIVEFFNIFLSRILFVNSPCLKIVFLLLKER